MTQSSRASWRNPDDAHPFAGILRLLAEAIADKIMADEKGASRGLGKHETALEPSEPLSVQGKSQEGHFLAGEEPRPPPPEQKGGQD